MPDGTMKTSPALAMAQRRHRQDLLAKIARLVKRGMPADEAKKLRARVAGYRLDVNPDGTPITKLLDAELESWDEVLRKQGHLGTSDEHMERLAKERADGILQGHGKALSTVPHRGGLGSAADHIH